MGVYLNPGNRGFASIRKGEYVDKTGLLSYINSTIDVASRCMTCVSRPRRFGKSYAAKMLSAYYDKSCDSRELFEDLVIAKDPSFDEHLNQYNILYLDITDFVARAHLSGKTALWELQNAVLKELQTEFPECVSEEVTYLADALYTIVSRGNGKFIVIIDEWDAMFREAKSNANLQKEYVLFLRSLFKNGALTAQIIAAAYMTGILPIKKYGTESAMTDFLEYTIISPKPLTEYVGFTEREVRALCEKYQLDFEKMSAWYDGYELGEVGHVYNPNSVMRALQCRSFQNYWTSSETYEALQGYISMNFDGLRETIIGLLGGLRMPVEIDTFKNDIVSFQNKDDVLTLLIHLGYLAYEGEPETQSGTVRIPNYEIQGAFRAAVKTADWTTVSRLLLESDELLKATLAMDEERVAATLELAHENCSAILKYNDENSLSCAISLAYYTARNRYMIIRELPAGKGFADLAFLPRRGSAAPALLIELKYNQSADTAIRQIHENRYDGELKKYFGNLLLVGINYDKDAKGEDRKRHSCRIEQM